VYKGQELHETKKSLGYSEYEHDYLWLSYKMENIKNSPKL
jgi:hypothetical protein